MIFVDTSIWVAALRKKGGQPTEHLKDILTRGDVALPVPVRVEILSGASHADLGQLQRLLGALPLFFPTDSTWERIESWLEKAISAGERFGIGDLLIGAIAAEQGGLLWSLDTDFARMAQLGFIEIYRPA